MDNTSKYFESSNTWSNEIASYQKEVFQDLFKLIPNNTKSLLDVGCGNGHFVNSIKSPHRIVGLDKSKEALKYVKVETICADITSMPLKDKEFDIVFATDILEHIEDDKLFSRAINELKRVVKHRLVITVPFDEDLNAGAIVCAKCMRFYHRNHHFRSFDIDSLEQISRMLNCANRFYVMTGDIWRRPPKEINLAAAVIGENAKLGGSVCPRCGSAEVYDGMPDRSFHQSSAEFLAKLHTNFDKRVLRFYDRSEVSLVLDFEDGIMPKLSGEIRRQEEFTGEHSYDLSVSKFDLTSGKFLEDIPSSGIFPYAIIKNKGQNSFKEGAAVKITNHNGLLVGFFGIRDPLMSSLSLLIRGTAGVRSKLKVARHDSGLSYTDITRVTVKGTFEADFKFPPKASQHGFLYSVDLETGCDPVVVSEIILKGVQPYAQRVSDEMLGADYIQLSYDPLVFLSTRIYNSHPSAIPDIWPRTRSVPIVCGARLSEFDFESAIELFKE